MAGPDELGMGFLNPILSQNEDARLQQAADIKAKSAPSDLAHVQALTRLATAEAGQKEYNLDAERKSGELMATMLGNGGDSSPKTPSEIMTAMARIYGVTGQPAAAEKAIAAASQASLRESRIAHNDDIELDKQFDQQMRAGTAAQKLLSGVTDQASWEAANKAFQETFKQPSPYAGLPYDPEMVKSIQGSLETANQKALDKYREAKLELARKNAGGLAGYRATKLLIEQQRADAETAREARLGKVGGKDVGAPTTNDIKAAERILRNQPGLVGEDQIGDAAYDVAAQARAKRKATPGMAADEAIRAAMADKVAAGDFTPAPEPTKILGFKVGSKGPGSYAGPPLSLPASGKASDLVVGKRYKGPTGEVKVWDGKNFKAVGAAPTAPARAAARMPVPALPDDGLDDDAED